METERAQDVSARAWRITRRWREYEGELRTAILRVVLVSAFYAVQLTHHFVFAEGSEADQLFHRQATAIAAVWLFVSLGVLVSLRQRYFPAALKFITCMFDLVLLTTCASLGAGPTSPLVGCYYVLIAAAGLRLSLALIWQATLVSMAAYMLLVGLVDSSWFDTEHATPLVQQLITLLSMAGTGVVMGQLVRMVAAAATDYAERCNDLLEPESSRE